MAKRTKYQAELLLRSLPPNAFDVLREVGARLQTMQTFPPGILQVIGATIATVVDETDNVKATRAEEKRAKPLAVADEA